MAGKDKEPSACANAASVARMKRRASQGFSQAKVEILAPQSGATVTNAGLVEGSADKPPDSFLWALARRKDFPGWRPQGTGDVSWKGIAGACPSPTVDPKIKGSASSWRLSWSTNRPTSCGLDWVARVSETGFFPPVQLPPPGFVLGEAFRTVKKAP
jgi:hypothetical protein